MPPVNQPTAINNSMPIEVPKFTAHGNGKPGEEAGRVGFATHLDADPYARAMAIATEIATKNPDAVRAAKDLFNRTPDLDTDAILMEESVLQDKIIRTPNQMEAVFAFMQKRAANFS